MKDSLVYRVSGNAQFNAAINGAKEWIDRNCNGLILNYSITVKLTPPEGETLREIVKTQPLFPNGTDPVAAPKQKRHRRTKAEMQAAQAMDGAE